MPDLIFITVAYALVWIVLTLAGIAANEALHRRQLRRHKRQLAHDQAEHEAALQRQADKPRVARGIRMTLNPNARKN